MSASFNFYVMCLLLAVQGGLFFMKWLNIGGLTSQTFVNSSYSLPIFSCCFSLSLVCFL